MKRATIILAAALCLHGAASAQTSVTIYGIVDAGLAYSRDSSAAGGAYRLDSGNLNGSRLGFRGEEDLGGGLAAIFQLENGYSTDTGALGQGGLLFGRQAWMGLKGNFGSLRMGRLPTVVFSNSGVFDPFANALAGDSARLISYSGSRTNNTVSYGYKAAGVRGELNYSFGETPGSTAPGRTVGASLGYAAGPVDAVLTHTDVKNAAGTDSAKTTLLGGNVDFGLVKAYAAHAWNKGAGTLDTRDVLLGIRMRVGGAGTVLASYIRKQDKARADGDAEQLGLGYIHDLSKRTSLYTSYSRLENDGAASYNAGAAGASVNLFNAGVRHRF